MSSRSFSRCSRRSGRNAWAAVVGGAVLLDGSGAAAEVVRYVDRQGRVHEVNVRVKEPPEEKAVKSEAPEVDASSAEGSEDFPYAALAREASQRYSLPVGLIRAVMKMESGFNPKAVSPKGAAGLMQLMPATASELGVVDPFEPRQNIMAGARYLKSLLDRYEGSLTLALAAYNAGTGAVAKYGGVPPFPETKRYVAGVVEGYRSYGKAISKRAGS